MKTQSNNRSTTRKVTIKGETHNVTEWVKILGKSRSYIYSHYC